MLDTDKFLAHYGKKGMKWGVRKESASAPLSGSLNGTVAGSERTYSRASTPVNDIGDKKALRKERAKKVAIGVGILAAVAGTAYVAHQVQKNGGVKVNDLPSKTKPEAKKSAKKILEQPTDIIYLSKPHKDAGVKKNGLITTPLDFVSDGKTKDYFTIFDDAGLNSDDFRPGDFKKMDDGSVAAYYNDIKGRRDAANRVIPHVVFVPSSMAKDINNIDDVVSKLGPDLDRRYEDNLVKQRAANT